LKRVSHLSGKFKTHWKKKKSWRYITPCHDHKKYPHPNEAQYLLQICSGTHWKTGERKKGIGSNVVMEMARRKGLLNFFFCLKSSNSGTCREEGQHSPKKHIFCGSNVHDKSTSRFFLAQHKKTKQQKDNFFPLAWRGCNRTTHPSSRQEPSESAIHFPDRVPGSGGGPASRNLQFQTKGSSAVQPGAAQ